MKNFTQGDRLALIIDAQNDFMNSNGALPVPDAEVVIPKLDEYLNQLSTENGYIGVLFTADTHTEETYLNSLEAIGDAKLGIPGFPPHCYEGTDGFNFAIDPKNVKIDNNFKRFILNKGVFNMWEEKDLVVRPYIFLDDDVDYYGEQRRDPFFSHLLDIGIVDVEVSGCATDFCVKWAIDGLLFRGFRVTVHENLVAGIERDIHQIVKEEFADENIQII